MVNENLVSYFPARVYNGIEDSAESVLNPANCRSSTVNLSTKDNFNFAQPEPVFVYTDIIKPDLVGDSYVRLLIFLHFYRTRVTTDLTTHCTSQWNSPL
jgi:hypothetical protein